MANIRIVVALAVLAITVTVLMPGSSLAQISPLKTTVVTDQTLYTYRAQVQVKGNLTLNGLPVNGLVGIEVNSLNASNTPSYAHMVTRTVMLGSPPPRSIFNITLVYVTPIADNGTPESIFRKGGDLGVRVNVTNYHFGSMPVLITVFAADSDGTPIASQVWWFQTTLLSGGGSVAFSPPPVSIDSWVSTGPAKVYANVYSDWPSNGGYPYTPEKSANVTILPATGSGSSTSYQQTPETGSSTIQSGSAYALSFRLPPYAPQGEYTVNATGAAQGWTAYASTVFNRPYQVLGDINFDHKIDILDVVLVTAAYGASSGSAKWDPKLDVHPDGKIDILDVVVVTSKYGLRY